MERQRAADKALEQAGRSKDLAAEAAKLGGQCRPWCGGGPPRRSRPGLLRAWPRTRRKSGSLRAVVLGGSPEGTRAARSWTDRRCRRRPVHAGDLVKRVAPLVGGGGGGSPEVAVAGGKDVAGIDNALEEARRALSGG